MGVSQLPGAGPPRAPAGLGTAGRRFWRSVVSSYGLRPDDLVVLEDCCRTIDVIQRLDEERNGALFAAGSTGQLVIHPALAERRRQSQLLARLTRQLKLPDDDAETAKIAESVKMRRVVGARYK